MTDEDIKSSPSLARKTKAEILEEYDKILRNYEQLKMKAKEVHETRSQELLEKTKKY